MAGTGLKIALVDKAKFPRDKVCGDAIGGRVKHVLRKIDPEYINKLDAFPATNISSSWSLHAPNGKSVDVHFVNPGYVSKREDFDNFLVDLVKDKGHITMIEGFFVRNISNEDGFQYLVNDLGDKLQTKLIIACDGAHSVAARQLSGFRVDHRHYSGAVRSYYKNISGITDKHSIEIHLLEGFLPGYFWIFPLGDTTANVGFGMLSDDIRKRKIDLKASFKKITNDNLKLSERFKYAEAISPLEGFGLPLGGKVRPISGTGFMLCGDAASLIDPLNGEGIGNAMWSGYYAAKQAEQCFVKNDFSSGYMCSYDKAIYKKLGNELRSKLLMQKVFNRPWLINALVNLGIKNPRIKNWIGRRL